ncbi:MAG: glycine--tRNA ligase [bacterium]
MTNQTNKVSMEKLESLCKRRGFIFQSSEIYGGISGFWDYGPLGCELKRNIRESWWKSMVRMRDDVVGLDASIIMHPKVWEASGHIGGFSDPMQNCKQCRKLYRADQVPEILKDSELFKSLASSFQEGREPDAETAFKWAMNKGRKLAPGLALLRQPDVQLAWLAERIEKAGGKAADPLQMLQCMATEQKDAAKPACPCPNCGGELTEPRQFNLMFKSHAGAMEDSGSVVYLRPETAQGIFVQFDNVVATSRQRVPFGIAQIGKAFRNEINPRNYTFRSREFEQMELEFFIKPGTDQEWHEYWVKERIKWYETIGLPPASITRHVYDKAELAHYASACVDVMYDFPFGTQELEGIAARGDYDLRRHQEFSGKSMEYFNQETNEKFIPHVIEPSAGVDRIALAVLCNAYREEWVPNDGGAAVAAEEGKPVPAGHELRTVMRFAPCVAPIKAAVFPLMKNKPELVTAAREVFDMLRKNWACFYDQTGAIGRRYRRQDEVGTPYCITIDFQTLEDKTVTLRERDSMKQERLPIADLMARMRQVLD